MEVGRWLSPALCGEPAGKGRGGEEWPEAGCRGVALAGVLPPRHALCTGRGSGGCAGTLAGVVLSRAGRGCIDIYFLKCVYRHNVFLLNMYIPIYTSPYIHRDI